MSSTKDPIQEIEQRQSDCLALDELSAEQWKEINNSIDMQMLKKPSLDERTNAIKGFLEWIVEQNIFIYADEEQMNADLVGRTMH